MIDIEKLKAAWERCTTYESLHGFSDVQGVKDFALICQAARAYLAMHEGMDEANKRALDAVERLIAYQKIKDHRSYNSELHYELEDDVLDNHIETIRAALMNAPSELRNEVAPKGDKWMPIETAPKDETPLLLLYGDMPLYGLWMNATDKDGSDLGQKWFCAPHGYYFGEPTHWMQLPAPPNNSSNDSKAVDGKERGE